MTPEADDDVVGMGISEEADAFAPDPAVEAIIGRTGPRGHRATRRVLHTILTVDPRWVGRIRFDAFRRAITLDGAAVTDAALTRLSCWIEAVYRATPGRDLVFEVAQCVADETVDHPVRTWLDGLCWDGVERVPDLLIRTLGAAPSPLVREMARVFLVSAVARALAPGCKVDTMLVLVGKQGSGKSRFCRALCPFADWFGDTPIDLRSKDAYLALQGKWIYEHAEMESLRGRSAARVKSYLSSPVDTFRAPYGRATQDHARGCVFIGTSNHPDLFDDGTGSRRFLPVTTGVIRLADLERDRDALWAEAVARYRRGETWHLDTTMEAAQRAEAPRFQLTDPHRERLETWLDGVKEPFTTVEAISEGLGVPPDRIDRSLATRIGPLLHELGCVKFRARRAGQRGWRWDTSYRTAT